jgi:hypothetical protein
MIILTETQHDTVRAAASALSYETRQQFLRDLSRRLAAMRKMPSDADVTESINAILEINRIFPDQKVGANK